MRLKPTIAELEQVEAVTIREVTRPVPEFLLEEINEEGRRDWAQTLFPALVIICAVMVALLLIIPFVWRAN